MDKIGIVNNLKSSISSPIYVDEPMKQHTSYKVGGLADIFIKVETIEDLKYILELANKEKQELHIIGNGTNLLVKDNGIRGITLKINFKEIKINEKEEYTEIEAGSGTSIASLSKTALENSLTGLEFACGIPASVGGAVRMNAGAYGSEMKDIVQSTTYMDLQGNIHTINLQEHEFEYRNSIFSKLDVIILKSTIRLKNGDKQEIKEKMEELQKQRKEKQPINMPSAGSVFKRQIGVITAKLIDDAGLKGYTIGGAQVSKLHAGFIVNTGNATANDILELIEYIKKQIYEKFEVKIEEEIQVIGE